MPTGHRTPTVFLLPVLLAGGACAGIASAQATSQFTNSGQALGSSDSFSVALGDLDGDGHLDAMVANGDQPNTVWTNDGNGTFTNSGQALGNSFSLSVALGDLDGDGDLDAMVANTSGQPNTVWTNNGNGTFTDTARVPTQHASAARVRTFAGVSRSTARPHSEPGGGRSPQRRSCHPGRTHAKERG